MVGVSPAFVISAYAPLFTASDYLASVPRVAALGYGTLQLEIYRAEALEEWTSPVRAEMRRRLDSAGLAPSQFVAHFALADFRSLESLERRENLERFGRFLELAGYFADCPVVTLPMPPFDPAGASDVEGFRVARAALVELLGVELEMARSAGKRLALELMPLSLVGGTEGFLRLLKEPGLGELAYNFDTGHAWARKERVELIPALVGNAIVGTHLCDNQGNENLKLRPGAGSLDFPAVLAALEANGYAGSYDLEISCRPENLDAEYRRGRDAICELLLATSGRTSRPQRQAKG